MVSRSVGSICLGGEGFLCLGFACLWSSCADDDDDDDDDDKADDVDVDE